MPNRATGWVLVLRGCKVIIQFANNINRAMQQANQNLEFEFIINTDTNQTVVKVVDKKTGELVRQIPSE
jgi:uncharacterized FlaG/YvyC family protein